MKRAICVVALMSASCASSVYEYSSNALHCNSLAIYRVDDETTIVEGCRKTATYRWAGLCRSSSSEGSKAVTLYRCPRGWILESIK